MAKTATSTTLKISIRLPEELADVFAARALKRGRETETEIAAHLSQTRDFNASQPIYIGDEGRSALSVLAGRALTSEASIISWAQNVSTIRVAGVEVPLSEQLLKRLSTRTFGKTLEDYIRQSVTESLESLVGMR